MVDSTRCHPQYFKGEDSKYDPIIYHAHLKMIHIRLHARATMHQGSDIYRHNYRAV